MDTQEHLDAGKPKKKKLSSAERKKKWKIRIIRLLLKGDTKNKSIKHKVIEQKQVLVENLVGNTVSGRDINELFWTYNKLHQDIFFPPHVKYLFPKAKVKIKGGDTINSSFEVPLLDYIKILSHIRLVLSPFMQQVAPIREAAQQDLEQQIDKLSHQRDLLQGDSHEKENDSDIHHLMHEVPTRKINTTFEKELYLEKFKKIFAPLYEEKYKQEKLVQDGNKLMINGEISAPKLIEFYAQITHYDQKVSLLNRALEGIDMAQNVVVDGVNISLKNFLSLLYGLQFSFNLFYPQEKIVIGDEDVSSNIKK